jgi:hypothetical protein
MTREELQGKIDSGEIVKRDDGLYHPAKGCDCPECRPGRALFEVELPPLSELTAEYRVTHACGHWNKGYCRPGEEQACIEQGSSRPCYGCQGAKWDSGVDYSMPIGVRASGDLQFAPVARELVRFTDETAQRIAFAATRLVSILDTDHSLTMKDAIAQAADAEGCAREDLCSYLLALGIGSLR